MFKKALVTSILAILSCHSSKAQSNDSTYYENWVGQWHRFENGDLAKAPSFIVKRGLYHSAFEEYWMGAGGDFSMAWRAWDSRTKKWEFAWMSADGLFQTWKGEKVKDVWYMTKTFLIKDQEVLSRQAFIPQGESELVRTSEHSRDGGKTWTLRFREVYRKKD